MWVQVRVALENPRVACDNPYLVELGFTRSKANHGVFFKQIGNDIVILAIHVNDGMITGNNDTLIKQFKEDINKKYKITDLGPVFSCWGSKSLRTWWRKQFPYPSKRTSR